MTDHLRRQLHYKNQRGYDPYISFDIDTYLVETFPTMSPKDRKSIWTTCQSSFEIDWEDIEEQILDCVYELFDDKYIEIVEDDDEFDDDSSRDVNAEEVSDDVSTES